MIFRRGAREIFHSPGSPKTHTIQQDKQQINSRKTKKEDNLQKITYRTSSKGNLLKMMCKVRQQFISNANTPRAHSGPVRIFGTVRGVRGAAEFKIISIFRFQKDFYLDLTRGAPQAGCDGWKSMPKWTPKVIPKSTFGRSGVRLLRFWACFWGVRFLMNFRLAKSLPKISDFGAEGRQNAF